VARRRDRLEALARDIQGAGGAALVIAADITDPAQAEAAVSQTVEHFGRLDTLVNTAGVLQHDTVASAITGGSRPEQITDNAVAPSGRYRARHSPASTTSSVPPSSATAAWSGRCRPRTGPPDPPEGGHNRPRRLGPPEPDQAF
jgi:NAD(P)-dependent dehydrogenase (short-subunit alcohol dehydrogenase family)